MKLLVLLVCVAVVLPEHSMGLPSPIVIIPGIMGSQLDVRDTSRQCFTGGLKQLWLNAIHITTQNTCAQRQLSLIYDTRSGHFHDGQFVTVSIPDFGGTKAVEYVVPNLYSYLNDMIQFFVRRGYKTSGYGKNIGAAAYDWRLAADELEHRNYYGALKTMIETMYNENRQTKVTLVAHSMGGLVSLYFLTRYNGINQTWKDKYIHAYIPIAAAWSGGVGTLQVVISGNRGVPRFIPFLNSAVGSFVVNTTRTFESLPWIFPTATAFGNRVLISTPHRRYTAYDYDKLFHYIGYHNGYSIFQRVQRLVGDYPAPNVPTFCYYGTRVRTPVRFHYNSDFYRVRSTVGLTSTVYYGDGDGSVNTESSQICHRWRNMRYPFRSRIFPNREHLDIVKDDSVLSNIANIVRAPRTSRPTNPFLNFFG